MKLPICPPDAGSRRVSISRPGSGRARAVLLSAACAGMALVATSLVANSARAACTPTSPADNASVVCSGTDSTGYDGSGADNLTITTGIAAELDDSDPGLDAAILIEDESSVDDRRGRDDQRDPAERLRHPRRRRQLHREQWPIELDADDTRGISIDENTTGRTSARATAPSTAARSGQRQPQLWPSRRRKRRHREFGQHQPHRRRDARPFGAATATDLSKRRQHDQQRRSSSTAPTPSA